MNPFIFLAALAPGFGFGVSIPSGETGKISGLGYWTEINAVAGLFSGTLLAEDFRSRGDGFYHATGLSLMGGVSYAPNRAFSLGLSAGPAWLMRTHSEASECGLGFVAEAEGSVFYAGEKARVGVLGFTRAYPGRSSVLLSFGIGLVAGLTPR
ncbi:MAG: hypothetical protein ABIM88_03255 [candidate division WOR-3 bacterium]